MAKELKLGLTFGYWQAQPPENMVATAREAEALGYDSVWSAEAWGSDAFTPLAWIGAHTERIKLGTGIVQISARTPACVAMTAMTLDHLSDGRLMLGFGVSVSTGLLIWARRRGARVVGSATLALGAAAFSLALAALW